MLKERAQARVLKYAEYDDKNRMLRLEDCNINEQNAKAIMYSIFSMNNHIQGLSFSYNSFFRDDCIR
jgi:hypothetical protein